MENDVPTRLRCAASTYAERSELYGDTYKNIGRVMQEMLPHGVHLVTVDDYNRYGCLSMIVAKLCRYSNNFNLGGHEDSLLDISVYAAMLNELDNEDVNTTI